jgi:hypothetical protein
MNAKTKSARQLAKEYTSVRQYGPGYWDAKFTVGAQTFAIGRGENASHAQYYCRMMGEALKRLIDIERGRAANHDNHK